MKLRKFAALVSFVLAFSLVVPFGTLAANGNGLAKAAAGASKAANGNGLARAAAGASKAANAADIKGLRDQIRTLNANIVADKTAIAKDIGQINRDLAGAKGDANITGSSSYQTVQSNLAAIKNDVKNANAINYKNGLGSMKGNNSSGAGSALSTVISQMQQKLADLDQAKALADQTLTLAADIYTQKQADMAAWKNFQSQASSLKQTIDQNSQQIASINDACKSAINQIVATFSANEDILSQNTTGLAKVQTELAAVKTEIAAEYNGDQLSNTSQYDTDRKNGDYSKALDDLNAIITRQASRITALQKVQTDLNQVLSDLNALVASGTSSSSSSVSAA